MTFQYDRKTLFCHSIFKVKFFLFLEIFKLWILFEARVSWKRNFCLFFFSKRGKVKLLLIYLLSYNLFVARDAFRLKNIFGFPKQCLLSHISFSIFSSLSPPRSPESSGWRRYRVPLKTRKEENYGGPWKVSSSCSPTNTNASFFPRKFALALSIFRSMQIVTKI